MYVYIVLLYVKQNKLFLHCIKVRVRGGNSFDIKTFCEHNCFKKKIKSTTLQYVRKGSPLLQLSGLDLFRIETCHFNINDLSGKVTHD